MTIPEEKGLLCLKALVEGNSIRSTERISGIHRDTIGRLLFSIGNRCEQFSERTIKGIPVNDVQCDEIWAFVDSKEKTKKRNGKGRLSGRRRLYFFGD